MARLTKNSLLEALTGTLGKQLVFKQYHDKTVVSKCPDMTRVKPSRKQKDQRTLMKKANDYASKINRDPVLRKKYEKKLKKGESIFHRAKKEFFEMRKKEK